jgi:hypothetical protein
MRSCEGLTNEFYKTCYTIVDSANHSQQQSVLLAAQPAITRDHKIAIFVLTSDTFGMPSYSTCEGVQVPDSLSIWFLQLLVRENILM